MAVKREKTETYDLRGTGYLTEITKEGYVFQDDKGEALIRFDEIQALIGQEITLTIKRTQKTIV